MYINPFMFNFIYMLPHMTTHIFKKSYKIRISKSPQQPYIFESPLNALSINIYNIIVTKTLQIIGGRVPRRRYNAKMYWKPSGTKKQLITLCKAAQFFFQYYHVVGTPYKHAKLVYLETYHSDQFFMIFFAS